MHILLMFIVFSQLAILSTIIPNRFRLAKCYPQFRNIINTALFHLHSNTLNLKYIYVIFVIYFDRVNSSKYIDIYKYILHCTIASKSRATFEIPLDELISQFIPFLDTFGFSNCYCSEGNNSEKKNALNGIFSFIHSTI